MSWKVWTGSEHIPCDHFPMIFCRGVLLSNYWVRKNLIHMEWKINHWCLKVLLTKNFLVLLIFAELPWKSNGPKISRDIDIREKMIVFLLKMTNIWKLVDRIFMEQCFWNFDSSKRKDQSWIALLWVLLQDAHNMPKNCLDFGQAGRKWKWWKLSNFTSFSDAIGALQVDPAKFLLRGLLNYCDSASISYW